MDIHYANLFFWNPAFYFLKTQIILKMTNLIKLLFACGLFLLLSCGKTSTEELILSDSAVETNGELGKFCAIGGSFMSGYKNGGLYREAQQTSVAALVAKQAGFKFTQALFPLEQANGTGYLANNNSTENTLNIERILANTAIVTTNPLRLSKFIGNINDLTSPNLRVLDLGVAGLGNSELPGFNPFFARVIPDGKENLTYTEWINTVSPEFFLCSLGESDLMDFALSGGRKSMTEISVFQKNLKLLTKVLASKQSKGVFFNIPDILALPYFNLKSFTQLSAESNIKGIFITTGNGIIRMATNRDKILMDAIKNIGTKDDKGRKKGFSADYPMGNSEVLDTDEQGFLALRINEYNAVLANESKLNGWILFDSFAFYNKVITNKLSEGVVVFNSSIINGNFFSLDGIQPSARGTALISNEIIKLMNDNYKNILKTTIPLLDVTKFEALKNK